ncbi:MAG: class I SAM-dependent methyltransferase [Herminiimonas sp.]|nr:class I SAM-dependent methyltransferase [Herminiimonas sp.]
MSDVPRIYWIEADQPQSARWRSGAGLAPPSRVIVADDSMTADSAFRLASEGTAILWRGDFQNARQLLQAIARRIDKPPRRVRKKSDAPATPLALFNAYRQAQSQRARTLGMLLMPIGAGYAMPLRRAPDLHEACTQAYGPADANADAAGTDSVASLREIQGLIGAYEWRRKGVDVAALGARIHPHYGVFAPIRNEYVALVAETALPSTTLAFDIGTGTGVLAAVLARRGVARIVATDLDERAIACARENIERLGLHDRVTVERADLFPAGRAPLVVCNPPWLPARPSSPLEHAVYDPDSRMLHGFLAGLAAHLAPGGEGWLILSDLAEHLGLRTRAALLEMIDRAGLRVLGRHDVRPQHPRASDTTDPLHAARAAEVTSLWRLAAKPSATA